MRLSSRNPPLNPFWQFFSVERAARTPTAVAWLVDNFVNAALAAPTTHEDLVRFVCASAFRPIPLISLSERLSDISLIRGASYSAMPGNILDEVARAHENMGWWVTDEGLHMEVIPPTNRVSELARFDRIAGALAVTSWDENLSKRNTRLTIEMVLAIALELDNKGITLAEVLQPKEKATLKEHNQRSGKLAVKSFRALADSRHSRILRRHLSDARAKYIKAASITREPVAIPRVFWSANPVAW